MPPENVLAEAADWIARLHDEQRSSNVETQVRAWLGGSEDHQRAFNLVTQAWELAGEIRMRSRDDISAARKARRSPIAVWTGALAATLVLAGIFVMYYYSREGAVVTRVGQQQVRMLPDGTRVLLNTDTRIEVDYDDRARRVRLIRGEAQFDVSKHPTWPFLVSVDGQEIRALGTSFIVRHDEIQDLSVTLVEGKISVAPIAGNDESPSQDPQILAPGQRLTISRNQAPTVDRPELNDVTAWERGEVDFGDTSLGDAAKEMNRYSTHHVAVADAEVAKLRIGGVFRAGHSEEFVSFVTTTFGLRADRRGNDIVLSQPTARGQLPLPVHSEH